MRFPTLFKRILPATPGTITLGSDALPTGAPSADLDNLLVAKNFNLTGDPVNRIAVTYWTDAGAPIDLVGKMYFFEDGSQQWYLVGQGTLKNGQVTFFDCISVSDPPQTLKNLQAGTSGSSSIAQVLIVEAGLAPNGHYVFTMAPDLSSTP